MAVKRIAFFLEFLVLYEVYAIGLSIVKPASLIKK